MVADLIPDARRVVIKIGSSLLVDAEAGGVRDAWLETLAAELVERYAEPIVVSSGAVALGRLALGLPQRPKTLAEAQAAAALGQIALANAWSRALAAAGRQTAQVLLSLGDLEDRRRYLNARDTLETLLARGIVAVANENDTVATGEIRFGDNDRLGARIAQLVQADLLILLSDVDGLMTADPRVDPAARLVERVAAIDAATRALAGPPAQRGVGTGGMVSKLAAAELATAAGCPVLLIGGRTTRPLARYARDGRGTFFEAARSSPAVRKQWLRSLQSARGRISVDAGAVRALRGGASLLPAGVTGVQGPFDRGDLVVVAQAGAEAIGQGLAGYGAADAARICGLRSDAIAQTLGYPGRGPMIHRDDLVLY